MIDAATARADAASAHPHHHSNDLDMEPVPDAIMDGVQPSQWPPGWREEQVCHDAAGPALRQRHHHCLLRRGVSKSSSPGGTPDDLPRRGRRSHRHHRQSSSAPSPTKSRPAPRRAAASFCLLSAPLLILILLSSSIATMAAASSWPSSSSAAFAPPRIINTPPGAGRWMAKSHSPARMRPYRNHHRRRTLMFISASLTNVDGGEMKTTQTQTGSRIRSSFSSSSSSSALFASSSPPPDGKSTKGDASTSTAEEFWESQRLLAKELSAEMDVEENALKRVQLEKFAKRRLALVSDTLFFSVLIFAALWGASDDPFTAISYLFGAILGTAYSYGLGKYVETLGGSAGNEEAVRGAGVGQARFAFLIVLFVLLGKFRGQTGLQEIPTISGFFTYQLASLSQGLREIDD